MQQTKLTYSSPNDPLLKRLFISSIEQLSGRPKLERTYNNILASKPGKSRIWQEMVTHLELELDYDHTKLQDISGDQPLVFIANHPFGVIDGVALGYLVSQVSTDFKFLVNEALCRDETLNEFFLPIDFANSKQAQLTNIETRRRALTFLSGHEPIVIFPSGGVATAPKPWKNAEELEWKKFVLKLIRSSNATVIPIYFYGQNSRLFQVASNISMELRLAFLLNEVRNKIGKQIKLEIGSPILPEEIEHYEKADVLAFLQKKVMSLKKIK